MASDKKRKKKARKALRRAQQLEPYRPGRQLSPMELMRRYYGTGVSYTGMSGGGAGGGGGSGGGLSSLLLEVGKIGGQLNALLADKRKKEKTVTESMGIPAEPAPSTPAPATPVPEPEPEPESTPLPPVSGMRRRREEMEQDSRIDTQRARTNQSIVDGMNRFAEEAARRYGTTPANQVVAQITQPPTPSYLPGMQRIMDEWRHGERPSRKRPASDVIVEDVDEEDEDGPKFPREGEIPLIEYTAPEPTPSPVVFVPIKPEDALAGMIEQDEETVNFPSAEPTTLTTQEAVVTDGNLEEPVAESGAESLVQPTPVEPVVELPTPTPGVFFDNLRKKKSKVETMVGTGEFMDQPPTAAPTPNPPPPPEPTEEDLARLEKEQKAVAEEKARKKAERIAKQQAKLAGESKKKKKSKPPEAQQPT